MKKCISLFLLCFVSLASGARASSGATNLNPSWATNSPPALSDNRGNVLTLDSPIGALDERKTALVLNTPASDAVGKGVIDIISNCRHLLDTAAVDSAAVQILRSSHLTFSFNAISSTQVVLISTPKNDRDTVYFYSFIANLSPCSDTCSVNISANKIRAPLKNGLILMTKRQLYDDSVTGLLIDSVSDAFNGCLKRPGK